MWVSSLKKIEVATSETMCSANNLIVVTSMFVSTVWLPVTDCPVT